jgi:hypothetical protein
MVLSFAGPTDTGRAVTNGKVRTGPGGRPQLPDELLPVAEVTQHSTRSGKELQQ